jgi:hypothetical protein
MTTQLARAAVPADTREVQALFREARRRRQRRWLAGIAAVVLAVSVAAVATTTISHRTLTREPGRTGPPAGAPAGPSSVAAVWVDGSSLYIGYLHPGGGVTERVVAEVNADTLPLLQAGGRVYWVDPAGTFVPALGHWSQVVRYLDVATGAIGTAGAGQTVFASADGRDLFMSQTATTLTETPVTGGGAVRSLTLPRGWYLPGGDGLADLFSGAGLATANGIVVQSQTSPDPDGLVLGLWNPDGGRVAVIGRARAVIDAYTPPGARYSLLAWLPAGCRPAGGCPLAITNTATLSARTVRSPLRGGFAIGGAFSPAGSSGARLAVFLNASSGNTGRLALVDLATGALRIAARLSLPMGEDIGWVRWLPDGTHLIAGAADGTSYLVSIATLSATPLVAAPGSAAGIDYTTAIVPRSG